MEIDLDPTNPRLSASEQGGSQDQLLEQMVLNFKVDEIGESIVRSGYIDLDPLIGYQSGNKIRVREGNRRISALKLLIDPSMAPPRAPIGSKLT